MVLNTKSVLKKNAKIENEYFYEISDSEIAREKLNRRKFV